MPDKIYVLNWEGFFKINGLSFYLKKYRTESIDDIWHFEDMFSVCDRKPWVWKTKIISTYNFQQSVKRICNLRILRWLHYKYLHVAFRYCWGPRANYTRPRWGSYFNKNNILDRTFNPPECVLRLDINSFFSFYW